MNYALANTLAGAALILLLTTAPWPQPRNRGIPHMAKHQMDDADATFLQDMIAHHQDALEMSQTYLDSTNPAIRQARVADLARTIIKAQTTEIAMMRGWLSAAGRPAAAPETDNSPGMDM